jgi:16S rRNA (uracil1498-N3)-methyltransferase
MTQPLRLYVDQSLSGGVSLRLTDGQAHYLGSVMRRQIGDPVLVFNGRDGEWLACVVTRSRAGTTLEVTEPTRAQRPEADLWLVFALLKRDATDLVVRMATELGVSAILPALTERTNAARVNEARLAAIAIEAAEQSERLTVPAIRSPAPLSRILSAWPAERRLFAAIERANAAPIPAGDGPRALLVGPEGGFTTGELDALRHSTFVIPVSLGPNILRAETACLTGLALLQAPGWG